MNEGGIVAQYGFLYQRKAFILCAIQNAGTNKLFTFEGKDDVEISTDERIFSISNFNDSCIQVKSGVLKESCFSKVICNWMLMDDYDKYSFELIVENDVEFDTCTYDRANAIYDFIIEGKSQRKSAIARKMYDKYISICNCDENDLIEKILKVTTSFKLTRFTMGKIEELARSLFSQIYCLDIVNYEIAKSKRFERFEEYLYSKIDDAIKNKNKYVLIFSDFIKVIMQVSEEISDKKYKVEYRPLKKKLEPLARKIVDERLHREVQQLHLVNSDEKFIIDNIVNELIYKDFRSVYDVEKRIDVSNWEEDAKENYDSSRYSINDQPINPRTLYLKTTDKLIESDLLPKSAIYSKGCYIYLTGKDIEEDKQISWGNDDEA